MLCDLEIRDGSDIDIDFDMEPWSKAALVTPRHAMREQWNEVAVWRHCQKSSHQLFICKAEDMVRPDRGQALRIAK